MSQIKKELLDTCKQDKIILEDKLKVLENKILEFTTSNPKIIELYESFVKREKDSYKEYETSVDELKKRIASCDTEIRIKTNDLKKLKTNISPSEEMFNTKRVVDGKNAEIAKLQSAVENLKGEEEKLNEQFKEKRENFEKEFEAMCSENEQFESLRVMRKERHDLNDELVALDKLKDDIKKMDKVESSC